MGQINTKPCALLKKYLKRKQKTYTKFSIRSMARTLSISPSYLSEIMSGKKNLPFSKLSDFAVVLDLDDYAVKQLEQAILNHQFPGLANSRSEQVSESSRMAEDFEPMPIEKYFLLDHWYYLALTELVTCKDFRDDPVWIGRKLGIPKEIAECALRQLTRQGVVSKNEKKYVKNNLKMRFPNKNAHPSIICYHHTMMKKAIADLLASQKSNVQYQKRLFNGLTLAIDPNKLQETKLALKNAVHRAALQASQGDCKEVYYINLSLFPLTEDIE